MAMRAGKLTRTALLHNTYHSLHSARLEVSRAEIYGLCPALALRDALHRETFMEIGSQTGPRLLSVLALPSFLAAKSLFHASPTRRALVTPEISDIPFLHPRFQTLISAEREVKVLRW